MHVKDKVVKADPDALADHSHDIINTYYVVLECEHYITTQIARDLT